MKNPRSANPQRASRLMYLQQKATATEAASKQKAISSGPPVAAEPLEEVVVTAKQPTFEDIQKDTRVGELDFAVSEGINALKSTAANLAGLPGDISNLLNVEKISGKRDFKKGTSAYFKELLGVDPGSFGDVIGDVNPMDGLATGVKLASQAGMLVPIGLWHNRAEAEQAEAIAQQVIKETNMDVLPIGDEWAAHNRTLFEKTGGWMMDFNGNLRRWFAPKEGGINPNIVQQDGKIIVRRDARLKDVLAPEVWSNFDPDSLQYLQNIPVRWISGAWGEWDPRKGIGMMMHTLYRDPAKFLDTLHHELGHAFDQMVGAGRGGQVENSLGRQAAGLRQDAAAQAIRAAAEKRGAGPLGNGLIEQLRQQARHNVMGDGQFDQKVAAQIIEAGKRAFGEAAVNDYLKATEEWWNIYKVDYQNYLNLSGEVLARAVGRTQEQSKFPLDDLDVPFADIAQMPERDPTGLSVLPQRDNAGNILIGNLVTELVGRSEITDLRKLEAEVQSGKWDNEIQRIVQEQRADAVRDKSKFKNPELNREYEEARRRLGLADTVRRERPERLNEAFPMTQDRPTLMRPRNTQGARLDDSRGGPPTKYEGFGQMMEGAELLATGREEVWKSGRFDIEAFRNKQERLARQRAVVAAKGSTSQATNKVKLEPKFWAYDPDAGKIAVVTAKADGGYEIKYKTGKITDAVMEKVDIVTNRQGLNEFISKTLWKRVTGEPIKYIED